MHEGMTMEKLYQETLPDGRVQYRYRYKDLSGKYRRVSCIKPNNSRRNYNEALYELQMRAVDASFSRLRCSGALRLYLADKKRVLRPQTLKRNEYGVRSVIEKLGDPWLEDLTVLGVKRAISGMSETNASYNERLSRFKAFLNWCYQNEVIKENIADKLIPLPDNQKERIADKYLEPEELQKLLEGMSVPMWYYLTYFMVLSGLRIGEAMALTLDDVGEYISVTKTYSLVTYEIGPTKTGVSREVYVQPELKDLIDEFLVFRSQYLAGKRSKIFFCGKSGGRMSYCAYNKYLNENSQRILGHEISTHALRHTSASLFIAAGVPLETVSRRLGHSDSRITKEIYLHLTSKLKEADNRYISGAKILP